MRVDGSGVLRHLPAENATDWDALYSAAIGDISGAVYIAGSSGNDSTGDGSYGSPYASITKGMQEISAGGAVIVKDGTYTNDSDLEFSDYGSDIFTDGNSASDRTRILAETPFGVRIKVTTGTYYQFMVGMFQCQYMWIDGFIFEAIGAGGISTFAVLDANDNIITRCGFKCDEHEDYGSMLLLSGARTLAQDCFGVGGSRYAFRQNMTGYSSVTEGPIMRRCVVRMDFSGTDQPIAPFANYGPNSGDGSVPTEFQNIISVDGPNIDTGLGSYSFKWGAMYNPKGTRRSITRGFIILNDGATLANFFPNDNVNSPNNDSFDVIVWDTDGPSAAGCDGVRASAGTHDLDRATIGLVADNYENGVISVTNAVESDTPQTYIPKADTPGTGATMMYAVGEFLSVHGDTDFDATTSDRLWPWPYEDEIKSLFSEQMNTPSGYDPSGNTSARGFCTGNNKSGAAQSLSKYIFEYGTSAGAGTEVTDWDDLY